jgi:hypothetical protein
MNPVPDDVLQRDLPASNIEIVVPVRRCRMLLAVVYQVASTCTGIVRARSFDQKSCGIASLVSMIQRPLLAAVNGQEAGGRHLK